MKNSNLFPMLIGAADLIAIVFGDGVSADGVSVDVCALVISGYEKTSKRITMKAKLINLGAAKS